MNVGEGKGTGREETWPLVQATDDASAPELISPARLLRYLDEAEAGEAPDEGGPVPRITSMPQGIKVVERRAGRAVAQWILNVRCECGRRWFEVEEIDTANCPRCGRLVYVDMDARSQRR